MSDPPRIRSVEYVEGMAANNANKIAELAMLRYILCNVG
jgi:hypothetical protein